METQKLNWGKILLLGFGFFSISITWSLYNAFVPIFLEKFISSVFWIGIIMTIDNYFGLFIQPLVGTLSDRTNTKYGRRMPYLLVGMPIAALFVFFVPFHFNFITLFVTIVVMNMSMSIFRSPTIALMPDITPRALHSKANGLINFMGGIGAVLAFGVGSILYKMNIALPFILAGVLILVSLAIMFWQIKEKRDVIHYTVETKEKFSFKALRTPNVLFLLLAIFFWFVSYQGVETLFTLYGKNHIGIDESAAAMSLAFFSLAFVLFAIPSGLLGTKFGKKPMIVIGIVGLVMVFSSLIFIQDMWTMRGVLLLGGLFWACININSYPVVIEMAEVKDIGQFTGFYYLFSSLAAIASPPLLGMLIDGFGYGVLFIYAVSAMVIALICILA
ncbi:MAG: SLC45 family MFS transporter, partial [Bacilli bacterium]